MNLLINGELVAGDDPVFFVTNPATGEEIKDHPVPQASEGQTHAAIEAAHASFPSWSKLTMDERKKYLESAYMTLKPYEAELAQLLHLEQGKLLPDASSEVESGIEVFRDAQKYALVERKIISTTETHSVEIHRKPIGVVAGIVPWNYPVYIALMKIAQALVYGNTIVVKPSPHTPIATLRIGEILRDVFPKGVLNIITGRDTRDSHCVGDILAKHALVGLTSFTGSIATGKRIFKNSAQRMGRMILELGGNDPALVLSDAKIEEAARGVLEGGLINSGQICCGIKRVFVHEKIYDEFVAKIAKLAVKRGQDNPLAPLNNRAQFERVCELVSDAVAAHGGKIVAGGKPPKHKDSNGFYFEPTIITNVTEGTRIVDEEQFGPVIPIMKFATNEEAITRANNTHYGLGASVWGTDPDEVNNVATQLQAGIVWTNEHAADTPFLPFGGMKQSGIGREADWGEFDINTYTEPQSVKLLRHR
jgi:acyl-CoA reductase-like NAD-dependent aldehyde dehydrogenase